jgi:hypothetical protein
MAADPRAAVMTTTEVADRLGVTTGRVRAMLRAGILHGERRAGVTLYLRRDVEAFAQKRARR